MNSFPVGPTHNTIHFYTLINPFFCREIIRGPPSHKSLENQFPIRILLQTEA